MHLKEFVMTIIKKIIIVELMGQRHLPVRTQSKCKSLWLGPYFGSFCQDKINEEKQKSKEALTWMCREHCLSFSGSRAIKWEVCDVKWSNCDRNHRRILGNIHSIETHPSAQPQLATHKQFKNKGASSNQFAAQNQMIFALPICWGYKWEV